MEKASTSIKKNSLKKLAILGICGLSFFFGVRCGIKGPPLPPETDQESVSQNSTQEKKQEKKPEQKSKPEKTSAEESGPEKKKAKPK